MSMAKLGLITGTGARVLEQARLLRQIAVDTPYGQTAVELSLIEWHGCELWYLPRHGEGHSVAPHKINYRANLTALRDQGVTDILALGAVGGIHPELQAAGSLAVPDQLIDYTWGRQSTFLDGEDLPLDHVDFTEPFDQRLRQKLLAAGERTNLSCRDGGVVGVTQGPRLETAAEIVRLSRDGCDLVGMTTMPEAILARELGINYGLLSVVVNAAAGLGSQPIAEEFAQRTEAAVSDAMKLLGSAISSFN